jgi:hypothetical protein
MQVDDMQGPHLSGPPVSGITSQWGTSGPPLRELAVLAAYEKHALRLAVTKAS